MPVLLVLPNIRLVVSVVALMLLLVLLLPNKPPVAVLPPFALLFPPNNELEVEAGLLLPNKPPDVVLFAFVVVPFPNSPPEGVGLETALLLVLFKLLKRPPLGFGRGWKALVAGVGVDVGVEVLKLLPNRELPPALAPNILYQ